MGRNRFKPVLLAVLVLIFVSLACSAAQPATPTAIPLPTETLIPPTNTSVPTSTPRPTATPNVAATKQIQDANANIQNYVEKGYLPSALGQFFTLADFKKELAKINYLDGEDAGYDQKIKDFAVWADINAENAGSVNYPEYSGCGFVFHYQDNGDTYYAMVTKDSVLVTYCLASLGNQCGRVGKTRGTGTVNLGNPLKAHFEFIVNGIHAYALVNGAFVAEYTLFEDKIASPGYLGYGMISGTNKDFGTRCEITNANLWVSSK